MQLFLLGDEKTSARNIRSVRLAFKMIRHFERSESFTGGINYLDHGAWKCPTSFLSWNGGKFFKPKCDSDSCFSEEIKQ